MSELDDLVARVGALLTAGRLPREVKRIMRLTDFDLKKLMTLWFEWNGTRPA